MSLQGRIDQQMLEKIVKLLEALEYGTIQITVHDSQITQIDRLEKHRFPLQSKAHPQTITNKRLSN